MAAAKAGNTHAQFAVARIYDAAERPKQAAPWYERAANGGIAEAQARLGAMFYQGQGTNRNYLAAAKWLRRAADQGDSAAFHDLSFCYYYGRGVRRDLIEAYKWMRLAELSDNRDATRHLNFMAPDLSAFNLEQALRRAREFETVKERIRHETQSGTGFFITADGYLITCADVIAGKKSFAIKIGPQTHRAKLIYANQKQNLALLKVAGKHEPLPINFIKQPKLGEPVYTLGFPNVWLLGDAPKLATGEISGLTGRQNDPWRLQISAPLQDGNSGGALVDRYGEIIGVVDSKTNEDSLPSDARGQMQSVGYSIRSKGLGRFLSRVPSLAAKLKHPGLRLELGSEALAEHLRRATVLVIARTK